ncbi:hydrolase [candidate division KSB3 bacterium]|uniref:Hydrolase n=1 Tax=candidate division KSB3 bacterium TaxID=2044937 RepID=A0A2G6E7G3_9BACT|nr:MAG: hydrolase [candidate division KSB3 bacterium]PIE30412.1 MAG: hydrolase [candidate division KSB3 bacterium]
MLERKNTVLVLIDIQERLFQAMHGKEALLINLQKLVRGIRVLNSPLLWTEQNPRGLGQTLPELCELLSGVEAIEKRCFSCCGQHQFVKQLKQVQCGQVLLAGIEAHVCVFQTAADLCSLGYEVQVVKDCVSSRTAENMQAGLERMKDSGVVVTSVEMALFEMVKVAEGDEFKEILKIVK